MSFAKLLSKDAGVGEPADGGSNVADDADSPKAGMHDAAKRMMAAMKSDDHEGFSGALEDWHDLRGPSGPAASAKSEDAKPYGAFGS